MADVRVRMVQSCVPFEYFRARYRRSIVYVQIIRTESVYITTIITALDSGRTSKCPQFSVGEGRHVDTLLCDVSLVELSREENGNVVSE